MRIRGKWLWEAVAFGAIAGLIGVGMFLGAKAATRESDPWRSQALADYLHYLERRDQYDLRDQRARDHIFERRLADAGLLPQAR